MMKATLEVFWPSDPAFSDADKVSRYDNLWDDCVMIDARIAALCGGHAIATLSDGYRAEYISDDCEPTGYRTKGVPCETV